MKPVTKAAVAAAALVIGAASAAGAAVTFDPDTGTGSVGKGDVQTALGLNNNQLRAQTGGFAFTVDSASQST
jgi:hypothetical protein